MTSVRTLALCLVLALGAVVSALLASGSGVEADEKAPARVFEMRTYYTNPGKLADLHARFRNHTNYLFVKHGMTLVGYWTPEGEGDVLVYMLAYPSREAREASWKAFMADSVWKEVFAASTKDGRLVRKVESKFLNPTDYSPIQ